MSNNLAMLSQKEKDKLNVDLIAASVAFKERHKIPVVAKIIECEQPEALRCWFHQRLIHHRQAALNRCY